MKRLMLTILVLLAIAPAALPISSVKYCTPVQGPKSFCGNQAGQGNGYTCLHWHPDEEFCKSEDEPIPSCCRAAEKDSGYTGCACCRSVHGSQRIDVQKRGSYQHNREAAEVEYAQ